MCYTKNGLILYNFTYRKTLLKKKKEKILFSLSLLQHPFISSSLCLTKNFFSSLFCTSSSATKSTSRYRYQRLRFDLPRKYTREEKEKLAKNLQCTLNEYNAEFTGIEERQKICEQQIVNKLKLVSNQLKIKFSSVDTFSPRKNECHNFMETEKNLSNKSEQKNFLKKLKTINEYIEEDNKKEKIKNIIEHRLEVLISILPEISQTTSSFCETFLAENEFVHTTLFLVRRNLNYLSSEIVLKTLLFLLSFPLPPNTSWSSSMLYGSDAIIYILFSTLKHNLHNLLLHNVLYDIVVMYECKKIIKNNLISDYQNNLATSSSTSNSSMCNTLIKTFIDVYPMFNETSFYYLLRCIFSVPSNSVDTLLLSQFLMNIKEWLAVYGFQNDIYLYALLCIKKHKLIQSENQLEFISEQLLYNINFIKKDMISTFIYTYAMLKSMYDNTSGGILVNPVHLPYSKQFIKVLRKKVEKDFHLLSLERATPIVHALVQLYASTKYLKNSLINKCFYGGLHLLKTSTFVTLVYTLNRMGISSSSSIRFCLTNAMFQHIPRMTPKLFTTVVESSKRISKSKKIKLAFYNGYLKLADFIHEQLVLEKQENKNFKASEQKLTNAEIVSAMKSFGEMRIHLIDDLPLKIMLSSVIFKLSSSNPLISSSFEKNKNDNTFLLEEGNEASTVPDCSFLPSDQNSFVTQFLPAKVLAQTDFKSSYSLYSSSNPSNISFRSAKPTNLLYSKNINMNNLTIDEVVAILDSLVYARIAACKPLITYIYNMFCKSKRYVSLYFQCKILYNMAILQINNENILNEFCSRIYNEANISMRPNLAVQLLWSILALDKEAIWVAKLSLPLLHYCHENYEEIGLKIELQNLLFESICILRTYDKNLANAALKLYEYGQQVVSCNDSNICVDKNKIERDKYLDDDFTLEIRDKEIKAKDYIQSVSYMCHRKKIKDNDKNLTGGYSTKKNREEEMKRGIAIENDNKDGELKRLSLLDSGWKHAAKNNVNDAHISLNEKKIKMESSQNEKYIDLEMHKKTQGSSHLSQKIICNAALLDNPVSLYEDNTHSKDEAARYGNTQENSDNITPKDYYDLNHEFNMTNLMRRDERKITINFPLSSVPSSLLSENEKTSYSILNDLQSAWRSRRKAENFMSKAHDIIGEVLGKLNISEITKNNECHPWGRIGEEEALEFGGFNRAWNIDCEYPIDWAQLKFKIAIILFNNSSISLLEKNEKNFREFDAYAEKQETLTSALDPNEDEENLMSGFSITDKRTSRNFHCKQSLCEQNKNKNIFSHEHSSPKAHYKKNTFFKELNILNDNDLKYQDLVNDVGSCFYHEQNFFNHSFDAKNYTEKISNDDSSLYINFYKNDFHFLADLNLKIKYLRYVEGWNVIPLYTHAIKRAGENATKAKSLQDKIDEANILFERKLKTMIKNSNLQNKNVFTYLANQIYYVLSDQ